MSKFRNYSWAFLMGCIILFLFRSWLGSGVISGSDFTHIYPSQFREFTLQPYAWSGIFGNGLGGLTLSILNLDFYLHGIGGFLVNELHLSWGQTYRLIFFLPFLFVGFGGAYYLGLSVVRNKVFAAVSPLIYLANTYILMLVGGGQVGLMMAYAVAPYVLASHINSQRMIFFVSSAFLVLFDLRFSVLIFGTVALYMCVMIPITQWLAKIRFVLLPMIGVLALHSFWLIPALSSGTLVVPEGYDDPGWLSFLSWAQFSGTLSLLHPNWPENIFGKTYFMRPEFIILPVIAFFPLLLARIKKSERVYHYYFFAMLLLVGAFFAKGVNPPFGQVYEWLFTHMPLFSGYRDPTKFYLLVSLAYTVLIPYSMYHVWEVTGAKIRQYIMMVFVLGIWGILILPFVTGSLGGVFQKTVIAPEYEQYEQLVAPSETYQRTLVVPWRNRFVYNSTFFPAMDISALVKTRDISVIAEKLKDPDMEYIFARYAIRYVVVPDDTTNEIFLTDRKYDPLLRQQIVGVLDGLNFLKKRTDFRRLTVYEVRRTGTHVYNEREPGILEPIPSQQENPTHYTIRLPDAGHVSSLVFAEQFDPRWQLWDGTEIVKGKKTHDGLISFDIPAGMNRPAEIYFSLQSKIYRWQTFSLAALVIIASYLLFFLWGKFKNNTLYRRLLCALFIVGDIGLIVLLFAFMQGATSPFILWSHDWVRVISPVDGRVFHRSNYEGSELRFRIVGARNVALEVSGVDPEYASTFHITVDGKPYTSDAIAGQPIDRFVIPGPATGFEVVIRTVCSGSPRCALTVRGISIPFGGMITAPRSDRRISMAILGDSISGMHGFHGYGYRVADSAGFLFHNASVIGGTLTEKSGFASGMNRYKKDIIAYIPDIVLIALGANDVIQGVTADNFAADYFNLVRSIKNELPDSQIVLMGIFRQTIEKDSEIKKYNQKIQEIGRVFNAVYIDTFSLVPRALYQDALHPSVAAQDSIMVAVMDAIAGGKKE